MDYPTLPQAFLEAVDRKATPRAQIHKVGNRWEDIASAEILRRVARLSAALAELGVGTGDRVGIFAANSPEWHHADFAVMGLGAVVVPVYFKESPERLEYILNHSEAKVVFVSGQLQTERLAAVRDKLPRVQRVIAAGCTDKKSNGLAADWLRYEDIVFGAATAWATSGEASRAALGEAHGDSDLAAYRQRAAKLQPDQLASIIYTSGTTGEPKGVMLSQENFSSNAAESFVNLPLTKDDIALSFLPLAHVYERLADYCYLFSGVPLAYVELPENVTQAMVEVRPTIVTAVPRFFEKLYAAVMEGGRRATGTRRRIFDWAMEVARRSVPWRCYGRPVGIGVKLEWEIADRLVYKKFRAGVGGRVREFVSGGAPLATDLAEFITTIGMPVLQGYGLTESSPVIASNTAGPNHIGTVGPPLANLEVRIADDGEILVRGPSVMMGYYKKPEETRATISPDGWLATGDIGHLDADGYLVVTDRKKELLKTAGGKLVAPAPIENALKGSPYIANAALVGDRRRFIGALIVPNFDAVEKAAKEAGVTIGSAAGSSPAEVAASPWAHQLIEKEIARLTASLAQYETIKRFALLDHDFTFENGELTYTLKLKRRVIEEHYAPVIEGLYAEAAAAR